MREVPERVLVIGDGVVACESSTWLNGLGAREVTVVEVAPSLLTAQEPFVGETIAAEFEQRGIKVRLGTEIQSVERPSARNTGVGRIHGGPATVTAGGSTFEVDEIVAAAAQQSSDPGERYIDTSTFLAHAVSVVRSHGFHRSDEEDATWHAALNRIEQGGEPAFQDLTRAREVRAWVSQLKQADDHGYRARLAACLARERLTSRELPLAASAVRAYNRQLYWQIRRERADRRSA